MSNLLFYNNSKTNLGAPVNPGDTTITLASGAGALFSPGPTGAQYFKITLSDALTGANNEICNCTNVTGDVLTVVRAQEGTAAQTWLVGDTAQGRVTAGALTTLGSEGAPTADKLTTARLIATSGDAVWSVSFDGSANVAAAIVLATVNGNVGTFGDSTHVAQVTYNGKGLATGVASVAIDFSGAVVASAAILTTTRNIAITGDLAWNVNFNGSAAVTAAGTLATVNSNVGAFGAPGFVPVLTVNGKGLITNVANVANRFKSANLGNPSSNAQYSVAHGLGATPIAVQAYIVCTSTNLSYAVGVVVAVGEGGSSRNDGASAWASPANVGVNVGTNSIAIVPNDGTGTGALIDATKWQIYVVATAA